MKSNRWIVGLAALGAASLLFSPAPDTRAAGKQTTPSRLPEFSASSQQQWINTQPLTLDDLKGRVTLVDIWTFDCWNCYRSIPWLNSLETKFEGREFGIVGIHTPEFEHEKVRANVEKKMAKFGVTHPVMMDNDFRYWRSLNNRYWPAFYIVDGAGRIRGHFVGETHAGDKRAVQMEALIESLLGDL